MKKHLASFFTITLFVCLFSAQRAHAAGAQLVVTGDEVIVYSGPSNRYRPLATGNKGDTFPVSQRRVLGRGGVEFWKVLVNFRGGTQKRIGYVSVTDPVELQGSESTEDVDAYQSLALAKTTAQFSFSGLKDRNYEVDIGFLKYPLPSFYYKFFAGQLITPVTGNFMGGAEIGLDHLMFGSFSLYGLVNAGVCLPATAGSVFAGSSSLVEFVQGAFGVRYSAGEFAAVSLGMLQGTFFSSDNSLLSTGYIATLEVGL